MSTLKMLDRPIAFQRAFVRLEIGITGALMLSQAIYWQNRTTSRDGYFYKTADDWEEETGLTRREQDTARKKLRELGIMDELKRGIPCKTWFRVNDIVLEQMLKTSLAESAKLDCTKAPNSICEISQSNTENTAENTTETTTDISAPIGAPCSVCGGRGEVGGWAGDGYHTEDCNRCNGTGAEPIGYFQNGIDHYETQSGQSNVYGISTEQAEMSNQDYIPDVGNMITHVDQSTAQSDSEPELNAKPKGSAAIRSKTKAGQLFDKVRSGSFSELSGLPDDLLTEWCKHRTRKNAADSDRALAKICETLKMLAVYNRISPEAAISIQLDRGWTTLEFDWVVNAAASMPKQPQNIAQRPHGANQAQGHGNTPVSTEEPPKRLAVDMTEDERTQSRDKLSGLRGLV